VLAIVVAPVTIYHRSREIIMRRPIARLPRRSALNLLALGDRITPAGVAYSAGTLTVMAASGDSITVVPGAAGIPGFLRVKNSSTVIFDSTTNQQVTNLVVKPGTATNYSLGLDPDVSLTSLTVGGASTNTSVTLGAGTVVNGGFAFTGNAVTAASDSIDVPSGVRIGGDVTLNVATGSNSVNLAGTIGGTVKVVGLGGSDAVGLGNTGALTIGGGLSINLGAGFNQFIGAANPVSVGKGLSYVGGLNDDRVNISPSTFRISGNLAVSLGGATAFNTFFSGALVVGGTFAVTGGAGEDDVAFVGASEVGGSVTASLGGGINGYLVGYSGGAASTIGGGIAYTGLAGRDSIYLDNVIVGRNVTASFGDGDSQVFRLGTRQGALVQIGGAVTLTTGNGADYVDISLTRIGGPLSLATVGGIDSVQIDDTNVNGPVRVDLGAGGDVLRVDTQSVTAGGTLLVGIVRFGSTLTVLGGDGNDLVDLSDTSGTSVRVGGNIHLFGGLGSDTFVHFEAGNLYLGAVKFEDFEMGESF
jgi:hypothetical protein